MHKIGKEITAEDIKSVRKRYGLSQQSFARLLGLGEASVARYENGQIPSKANANLIRAACDPAFILDCLSRDGDVLSREQYDKTESIVYSLVRLDEDGDSMDINQIYEITLQQEILNEQAAQYLGELINLQILAKEQGDAVREMIYEDAMMQIAVAKSRITDGKHSDEVSLAEVRGQIEGLYRFARRIELKAA